MAKPTNGELKIMLDNQDKKFDEKNGDIMRILREVRDDVKDTKTQALLTNGQVNELKWWRKAFVWGLGAVWTLIILLAPIVYIIMKHEIKKTVDESLQAYFEQYQINIK